jgi:CRISPR system Cascade subunit CasA
MSTFLSLNLITDAWMPVRHKDGSRAVIAPWQVADESLAFPDWPRPDLNIACLELLVGLVFLADPPSDSDDWRARQQPDPERLRERLAPFAPAFELMGDGPRFMQDLEPLECEVKLSTPDMLFIDSAGGQTLRNNADIMVRRRRYPGVEPPLAAIALYALQAHAPSGGKGNRTSMRGGGPMVTMIDPGLGLWQLVWANVPNGTLASPDALPWIRSPRTSNNGEQVFPADAHPAEAFFSQPRRLRLIAEHGRITGVAQKPYGANYAGWEHPLTPHYRVKAGSELLPRHSRPGSFGYRNWLGVTARQKTTDDTARRAKVVDLWGQRTQAFAEVIVAGWAMDNMKPRDFTFSRAPLINLPDELVERMEGMVVAAESIALALRGAIQPLFAEGEAREAIREAFFIQTQAPFEARLTRLKSSTWEELARDWLGDLQGAALELFEAQALPGLAERDVKEQAEIVQARRNLTAAFQGYGKQGREAFKALGLPVPEQKKRKAA